MGTPTKLNEGKIYRFLKTAMLLRRMQWQRRKTNSYTLADALEEHRLEIVFDAQLDSLLEDVDDVDVERAIRKLSEL